MQTLELPDRPRRLPSLTGMRGIAAMLVLITHLAGVFPGQPGLVKTVGMTGLTFFFIVSGFILAWVSDPKDTLLSFWRRRLVKLFPNHLVTFVATTALMLMAGVPIMVINTIPVLFLIEPWIPHFDARGGLIGINVPTWSLCCELVFYFCFPWLMKLVARIRPERLWAWALGIGTAIVLVPFTAQLLPKTPVTTWDPTIPEWHSWFVYSFPFTRMLEFVLGLLMARILASGKWIRLGVAPALLLAVVCTVVQSHLPGIFRISAATTAFAVALLITACAGADMNGVRTLASGKKMVWLGEISFAFYMVHWLVIEYGPIDLVHVTSAGPDTSLWMWLVRIPLTVVLSFGFAIALYTLVERPAVRRFSRPAAPREKPVTVPDPVDTK